MYKKTVIEYDDNGNKVRETIEEFETRPDDKTSVVTGR